MLWAVAHGDTCSGKYECHWCGNPCKDEVVHDDHPPIPFVRNSRSSALRPGNAFICKGCQIFRRKRITVTGLGGGFADSKNSKDFSWWCSERGAWILEKKDFPVLYPILLTPPLKFVLALRDSSGGDNVVHMMVCNAHEQIKANTELFFTINGVKHNFCLYDLQSCIVDNIGSSSPGVAALVRFLGKPPDIITTSQEKKHDHGRGPKMIESGKITQQVVVGQK